MLAQQVLDTLPIFLENINKYRDKSYLVQLGEYKLTFQNYYFVVIDAYVNYKCGRNDIVSIYNYSENDLNLSYNFQLHITREVFEDYVCKLHRLITSLSVAYNNIIVSSYEDRMSDLRTAVFFIIAADYTSGNLNEEYDIVLKPDGTVNYTIPTDTETTEEVEFYNPYQIEDELAELRQGMEYEDLTTEGEVPFMSEASPDEVDKLREKLGNLQDIIQKLTTQLPSNEYTQGMTRESETHIWNLILTILADLATLTTPEDVSEVASNIEQYLEIKLDNIHTGLKSDNDDIQNGLITTLNEIYQHYKDHELIKFYKGQSSLEPVLYNLKTLEFLIAHLLLVISPELYYNYLIIKQDILQQSTKTDSPRPGTNFRELAVRELAIFTKHAVEQGNYDEHMEEMFKKLAEESGAADIELTLARTKMQDTLLESEADIEFNIEEQIDPSPQIELESSEVDKLSFDDEELEEPPESKTTLDEEDKHEETPVAGYPGWKRVTNSDAEFLYYIYRFKNKNNEQDEYYAYDNKELQEVCDEHQISNYTKTKPAKPKTPEKKKKELTDCQKRRNQRAKSSKALTGKRRARVRRKMSKTGEKWMKIILDGGKLVGYGKPIAKFDRRCLKGITYSHRSSNLKDFLRNHKSGDCWALSDYIQSKLKQFGYSSRIMDYPTSMSRHHRTVQVWDNHKNRWYNFDYSGLDKKFHPTNRVNSGALHSKIATVTWTVNNARAKIIGVSNKYNGATYTKIVRHYPECKG